VYGSQSCSGDVQVEFWARFESTFTTFLSSEAIEPLIFNLSIVPSLKLKLLSVLVSKMKAAMSWVKDKQI
jgi:hypothetical protein